MAAMTDDKNRPIRISATVNLPRGAKVLVGQGANVTNGYIWLEFETFYGYSPLTMFLPDWAPFEQVEKIAALFNEILALNEEITADAIAD